ncbi:FMN-binding domain-containing protein [Geosporobacter subterraneus DSM 17957]|uniref:FMN-binding domain-containing protein n=1 Tax=Geosporobacter subterraneus DSM 17957 TaxID=1121919 RepID=A0A1M6KYE4_9FIRM|nr:copper amine oxidase N-terminal domain-containing protein [Geosporobacter subterraneus]SHJ63958.1 FMN-binding domain-containing protein [Geosporobacter subterraneus DSM 17957]
MKKFISGLIIGSMLMTGAAYAAGAKIEVTFKPLKYYVDGVEKVPPADQAGFIYKGRTYVPLAFVSESLGKEVKWDGTTSSIYIGTQPAKTESKTSQSYENGTYRGAYIDGGYMQVGVEFKLEDNIIKSMALKHLEYKGINYLKEEENKTVVGVRGQYQKLADYLVGKDIRDSLSDLYDPGKIVTENVDALTGATLRSGKIISSVRDALNRGVYKY